MLRLVGLRTSWLTDAVAVAAAAVGVVLVVVGTCRNMSVVVRGV